MAKSEKIELTPAEEAKILSAELAEFPCYGCRRRNNRCRYMTCWKYKTWLRLKWREITGRLKGR